MNNEYICPCCGESVSEDHFACKFASKGGTAGKGKCKARTPEQARIAALARWAKERESKKVEVPENFGNFEPIEEPKEDTEN